VYPLSENSWNNPDFVKRFLGSYGVQTRVEPEISREESQFFNELVELMRTDLPAATQRLRAYLKPESSAALDYTLGSMLLQQGDNAGAIRQYEAAIRKFPNFMRAYKNVGLAHLQNGGFAQAIPMLVKAIELGDGDGNTYGMLAYCYLNTDKPLSALDAYRLAYVLRPENRDWKVGKAQSLNATGDFRQAVALLKELIEEDPANTSYWTTRANAFVSSGNELEAATHLEMVKRMHRADASALRLLGDIYLNQQVFALARDNYLAAMRLDRRLPPDRAIACASNLARFGAYALAGELAAEMQTIYGTDLSEQQTIHLLNVRAEVSLAMGDDAAAAAILEQVLDIDPLNGHALLLLGNYHSRLENTEEAAFFYERAESIPTVQVQAFIQHARMLVARRNYEKAIRKLEEAQRLRYQANVDSYLNAVRSAWEASR
jgi:tetratricopeptide (TPR) repeat protein